MTKYYSDLGGYKIAPMDTYFPLADTDNSLTLLQKMPENSTGFFVLTGVNSRMGLTGLAGTVTYVFYRERGTYGSITAVTKSGIKTRVWENGTLLEWGSHVTNSDLANPYKKTLLSWGNYVDGTYVLSGSISNKAISITAGSNGRLRSEWANSQVNDVRSIVIPGSVINITVISDTQVKISGTTEEYRVRDILAM